MGDTVGPQCFGSSDRSQRQWNDPRLERGENQVSKSLEMKPSNEKSDKNDRLESTIVQSVDESWETENESIPGKHPGHQYIPPPLASHPTYYSSVGRRNRVGGYYESSHQSPRRPPPPPPPPPNPSSENVPQRRPPETQFARIKASTMEALDYETSLQRLYGPALISAKNGVVVVNLAPLQLIKLLRLRRLLVKEAFEFKYIPPNCRDDYMDESLYAGRRERVFSDYNYSAIHQYGEFMNMLSLIFQKFADITVVQALNDEEYIIRCASKSKEADPFILTTDKMLDRKLMEDIKEEIGKKISRHPQIRRNSDALSIFNKDIKLLEKLAKPRDSENVEVFGGSRHKANRREAFEAFLKRLVMSFLGGAFLVTPMVIMVLNKGILTALLTASLCIMVFGIVLSLSLDSPFEVLSATAAYAAVLVVFVGTNNPQG